MISADRQQVLRLIEAEAAQVVDVLPPREYDESHIPGAISIPLNSSRPRQLLVRRRTITSREEHEMQTRETDRLPQAARQRIGPIGRLVRVFGAVIMALFAYDWLEAGMTWFGQASTPSNPWVWAVTGLAAYYGLHQLPDSGFGRPWGERVLATVGGLLVLIAVVTLSLHGELWAPPLTNALYGFNVAFLFVVSLSYLVAVFLRTPGCEVGGLGELIRRLRGVPDPANHDAMWCAVGIHCLDQWEADRRQQPAR